MAQSSRLTGHGRWCTAYRFLFNDAMKAEGFTRVK